MLVQLAPEVFSCLALPKMGREKREMGPLRVFSQSKSANCGEIFILCRIVFKI